MTTFTMWKGNLALKIMMIILSFTVLSFGNTSVFIGLGIVILLGGCFFAFRQGQGIGHEACSVLHSVNRVKNDSEKAGQIDPKMYKQAFSVQNGLRALFASALVPYVINCVYIILRLAQVNEIAVFISRFVSFIVSMPFWPLLAGVHENFTALSADIIIMLMVGPFVVPAFQFWGYMQGPKLWAKTEKAMAEGKRRAKARSRIVKKEKKVRAQRPEI